MNFATATLLVTSAAPKGHWGLGPSLLYLFGILAAVIYFGWKNSPRRGPTEEELRERRKAEAFTKALQKNRWNSW